ncbi:MAG: alpha/beta hydrolase [Gluconacetobacter sp.]
MPATDHHDHGVDTQRQLSPGRQTSPLARVPPVAAELIDILSRFEIVVVPGLDGSGPDHWQSRWEHFLPQHGIALHRVTQSNWEQPTYLAWCAGLQQTLETCLRPTILAAHSLGAILVARWASERPTERVAGALLVAPADVELYHGPDAKRVADFIPLPAGRLPFPSTLVASRNDEWLDMRRARVMAHRWGSTLLDAGQIGHIGNRSGLGLWSAGLSALGDLARSLSGISACASDPNVFQ